MIVKYYGSSVTRQYVGWNATHPVITTLYATDPYKHTTPHPSYCVWIVPGTVDVDGNDVTYGPANA